MLWKVSYIAPNCINEYEKEKEKKNMTNCHGELLMTMSDYLLNNPLVY